MSFPFSQISKCSKDLFIIDVVLTTTSILVLGLRFWAIRFAGRKIYWDDYCVVFAFVSKFILSSSALWGTLNGLGKHIWELTENQLTIQVKLLLISEFTYLLGTAFVKLSMLCLYHRIYTTQTFRRWCYVVIAADVIYIVSFIPVFLTGCIPLSQYWDPQPGGWCRDTLIGDNATVGVNLVLDFAVLLLPLPVLWRLQMSVRDKLTVTAMFSIGFVTIALVFYRLSVTLRTRASPDWTASLCEVGIIAALEVHLGIIAVCIPTLGPLFNAYVKPVLNRWGIAKTTAGSRLGPKKSFLATIGGTNTNKRTQKGYTEFSDSVDQIVTRDNSIKLTPTGEGKVVVDIAFEPIKETRTPDHPQSGIHVQRDIEAIYHQKKGPYFDE
ncbi:putative integral membrane protein [Rosellinia necatrix]|uniref:Putative integral membrane protein n=1 Tax=Rosellinia necatrix TaxID=77044 RepID=A0A1W2TGK2_ROSNE|nr:putative integral membrane protein [Rosellinia necatrix]